MAAAPHTRLSMREAAHYFGHSYSWIWANHRSMGLNGYRIGGRWFFDLQDLIDWEENQKSMHQNKCKTNLHNLNKSQKVVFA